MENKYVEIRRMGCVKLRSFCIQHRLCTRADNEYYAEIMGIADKENLSTDDIILIARKILWCSRTDYDIETLAFELARLCCTFFEKQ